MQIQLSDMTVEVNNEALAIIPNTLVYNDGFGEQKVRAMSTGGGGVELVYSNDIESNIGKCNFEIASTPDNAALVRQFKVNLNTNGIRIYGSTSDGKTLTRTFTQAALVNDPEIAIGSETTISLEFMANPAI